MSLIKEINTASHDEIYETIIKMHENLNEEESALVNAKLILILANHIGDANVISQAADLARGDH
ncbi:DUF2783 domain-containing protein [Sneathiella aquimaris]|uniref:DUF2783 domain-containing protein n=1 Tax=Sneathiella aquimaris TaxID=2599305 RepID=UPI00146A9729|nr:DUF2783 domain-containing protein [Sneathiella aquimaris]